MFNFLGGEEPQLRFVDLLSIALSALYQQKVRSLLTTAGVTIGSFILMTALSVGRGVEGVVFREFTKHDQLRQIQVNSGYKAKESSIPSEELIIKGTMSEAKRERLRKAVLRWWSRRNIHHPVVPLTKERLDALEQIEHVEKLLPFVFQGCRAFLGEKNWEVTSCASPATNTHLRARIVAGEFFESDTEEAVVVHEYLLYLLGLTSDEEAQSVVGKTLRLEFRMGRRRSPALLVTLLNSRRAYLSAEEEKVLEKTVQQLPSALEKLDLTSEEKNTLQRILKEPAREPKAIPEFTFARDFVIKGVIREYSDEDLVSTWDVGRIVREAEVFFPVKTAELMFAQTPQYRDHGFDTVTVVVDKEENVAEVVRQIREMGLQEFSLIKVYEQVRTNVVLFTFVISFFAVIALVVAALSITNTMVMGVLERTREIGIMKAVGARDGHIQFIFLVEGSLVGALGGGLGIFLSWLASFPGDSIGDSLMVKQTGNHLEGSLFVFPLWLTLGIPLLVVFITTLAAVYPARRAAKINPIQALRHE
jgi:putative ABC transport system permease protein